MAMPEGRKNKPGFTTVELILVIAIIGVIAGMLLPAIQEVREQERRTRCMSNVRQLSIAALRYESSHMSFPSGVIDNDDDLSDALRVGWIDMLPFFDQATIYERYDLESDWKSPNNVELARIQLPIFRCPSSDGIVGELGSIKGAVSDYAMSKGPSATLVRDPLLKMGVFDVNSKTTAAQIRDGLSNTFLIGEAVSNRRIKAKSL